jgi:putative heme-binding domain-containing protein
MSDVRMRFARPAATALAAAVVMWGAAAARADEPKGQEKPQPKAAPPAKPLPQKREATPADALSVPPGFKVELLHTAEPTEGSWINLAKDNKGRLITGGQRGHATLRFTLKDGKVEKVEKLTLPISEIMGVTYAFDSLYVVGSGPGGAYGLFRCRDTKGEDQYDDVKLLKNFGSGGEHGAHAVVAGPDGKIYCINGNHTKVPEGMSPNSPHRNYAEDHLLPRQWDGNGHAAGILAPGGYVLRTDPDGKEWELLLAGFRNAYDIAFNPDGELFTFDSDMEWDWGMPWYRPIRVNHCVSAAEFGWRSGTGKWPAYYPDSLPAVVDVGVGSPTGVTNGIGAKFPAKYQKAVYVLDWTYGRLIAVHLTPKGSTYTAEIENFVAPKGLKGEGRKYPLPLTDAVIGEDGAMYFTIGGRNNQSGLYRVSYEGTEPAAPLPAAELADKNPATVEARKLRRSLEAFHGKADPKAVETAWAHLGSDDRNIRYAARVAVEWQPVEQWKAKAVAETNPASAMAALLALARSSGGKRDTQPELLAALGRFPLDSLTPALKLDKLRVMGVSFARQGRPSVEAAKKILAELDSAFPSADETLNRELVQVLVYLHSTKVLSKALKQMAEAKTAEDRMHYLFHLRTLPVGSWTIEQRKEYLAYWTQAKPLPHPAEMEAWFASAGRGVSDGASHKNFLRNFLREAVVNMSDAERKALSETLASIDKSASAGYDVPQRPVVKAWTMAEIEPQLSKVDSGRSYDKGKTAYLAGQCIKCHRFGNEGGAVGPDLTAVSSRFGRREILESILEPSKVISDQYQNIMIKTTDDRTIVGRIVDDSADKLVIQPNPLDPGRTEVKKSEIEAMKPSDISPMPAHLADVLTAEEILDLIAYLESGGNKGYKAFKK